MNLQKNEQIANRYGLNIRLCDVDDISVVYQVIDFANISSVSIKSDTIFARAGASHEKSVGFYDKIVGEFALTTQILTNDLLCLMAGTAVSWDGTSPIVFKSNLLGQVRTFALLCETVWQSKDGGPHNETLFFHRVVPRVAYNRKYAFSGDAESVTIFFDIMQDTTGRALTRGSESALSANGTIITSYGYVTEDGVWVLDDSASVDGDTVIIKG